MLSGLIVTIDGPAGVGKSTVSKLLAGRLGLDFLDTGAMYRAITVCAMRREIDLQEPDKLLEMIGGIDFEFNVLGDQMQVLVDGEDVTEDIRIPEVTANVKYIAGEGRLRAELVEMQRYFAMTRNGIVTEGRDQGTVVFPEANCKFFLTGDSRERARRRVEQLGEKGSELGIEKIMKSIESRDASDMNRADGPLKAAVDAVIIDTTELTVDEVVDRMVECVWSE